MIKEEVTQESKNQATNNEISIRTVDIETLDYSFAQFFEINPTLKVRSKYNLKENMENLNNLSDKQIINDIKTNVKLEETISVISDKVFQIKSMNFLTSKETNMTEKNFINLVSMEEYLDKTNKNIEYDCGITLQFLNERNKINIKSYVKPFQFSKNIFDNLCAKSNYKKVKEIVQKLSSEYLFKKSYEFDMEIKYNSINQIYYTDNEIILDLQFPPVYKTNFLKFDDDTDFVDKKVEFEHVIFPFRNFENEITNLKFRRLYLLIKPFVNNNGEKEEYENYEKYTYEDDTILKNFKLLFQNKENKIKHFITGFFDIFKNDEEFKKKFNFAPNKEINDYFDFVNDKKIYNIFHNLGFIKDKKPNEDSIENKDLFDLELIKFYYQIVAIVSQNILTYYNAIEFLENFLYLKKKNYRMEIFNKCSADEYPILFNETLTRILDIYQNMQQEFNMLDFENKLKERFEIVYSEYQAKGLNYILKPSKNKTLERIQRIIITPTYVLFTPYSLDQGNRILREFIQHPFLGIIGVFKMDDFDEGRWNNRFLIEYIKFFLTKGIKISNRLYTFFDFSQSQFRNRACWLLTNPEKILPKTGDYSRINIVAKYGARISQTLTTTQKTAIIRKENIKFIDDVKRGNYVFSDGVGKMSYNLAKKITDIIHLKEVPAAFQGRFLGCKGVWTTMYNDHSDNIYIRPSQNKFDVQLKDEQYFELCDYSRYIQAYLNRQIILLLSSLGIKDEIFHKKLDEYRASLEDEKFVLSLIHYEEWNRLFHELYMNGINMRNDRLMKSLIDNNKDLLYNDLKNKARIYIKDSAYVIGIMDEYNILEKNEAFLRIKRKNFDLTLNQICSIAKCPCLHPGDIRKLNFRKYIPGNKSTEKFKIFDKYCNVLIFPQRGKRPQPNKLSGSDLDGDNYFVFYDKDLIPEHKYKAMKYDDTSVKTKKKSKITIKNIIKYFAEYTNLNNLGLIGDAHLAMSDQDPLGAAGEIPKAIAKKFSRAVDAPKTGDKVILSEKETPKKFPHYMEKKKTRRSEKIIGQLYDAIENYKRELSKGLKYKSKNNIVQNMKDSDSEDDMTNNYNFINNFFDSDLCIFSDSNKNLSWKKFAFLGLLFYKEYHEEILKLLKKNEIKAESVLLTGNNVDNEMSIFSKKKNNYDLRDKVTTEMIELFRKFNGKFYYALKYIFGKITYNELGNLNEELFFRNNAHLFASACYMVSYDFKEILSDYLNNLNEYKITFVDSLYEATGNDEEEFENNEIISQYECQNLGVDPFDSFNGLNNEYYENKFKKQHEIDKIIKLNFEVLQSFLYGCQKSDKLSDQPMIETQYRILSFPWCMCGKLLSKMKFIK